MKKLFTSLTILPLLAISAMAADTINGAGATFPAPIYQKWFDEFKAAHPGVQVNYQPIGSGGGITQLQKGTVDFGASDMPMTDDQIKQTPVKPLHFPTVMGAVVLSYNIPGVTAKLKFSPESIVGMYLGTVQKWNDPKIKADNPGVNLPDKEIEIVHRSDGSGTTYVFTDYLSAISADWKTKVGRNSAVAWPVGLGGKGSDGVEGLIKQTPNSIGYVELYYAINNHMAFADVKNQAGKYVTASFDSVSQAAANSKEMPADFRASIVNAPGAASYPLSTFTWLLIPSEIKDPAKKKDLTDFLAWMLTTGQNDAQGLSYAPLPKSVVSKVQAQIKMVK